MHLDDKYTIIFNGEIYNHQEIRENLTLPATPLQIQKPYCCCIKNLEPNFLHHLDGMFVFAIHDKLKNTLFIARDRAGKKPLYYYKDKEKLCLQVN